MTKKTSISMRDKRRATLDRRKMRETQKAGGFRTRSIYFKSAGIKS